MGMTASLFPDEQLGTQPLEGLKVGFCDHVAFRAVDAGENLFDGFKEMKAITWSYGLGMLVRQMRKFQKVELVFGCSAMLDDEVKLSALGPLVQQAQVIRDLQSKLGKEISERVEEGSCSLFFESTVQSHQKLYLLSDSEKGRYRVLTGSANFSDRAWRGDKQKEVILCFEGKDSYDAFLRNIYEPFRKTCATHVKSLKAIIEKADEAGMVTLDELPIVKPEGGLVIIQESTEADVRISMADCALYGGLEREDAKTLESALKLSGGNVVLDTHGVESLMLEGQRIQDARAEQMAVCPKLIVADDGSVTMNGVALETQGYKRDAATVIEFVESLDIFSGDTASYKQTAWKIICWYFATPFFPRLRRKCREARQDGRVSSMPMYLFLFGSSNAGKTALMRFLGKAMCGEEVAQLAGNALRAGKAVKKVSASTIRKPRLMQINQCGLPVLYDDVAGAELTDSALRKLLIDAQDAAYDERYPYYPAIVATSNITPAMPREFRKRALFFESSASLSQMDAIANGHVPSSLTKCVGSGLFAEYAKKMAAQLGAMLEEGVEALDVYKASSAVLIELFAESGEVPSWAVPLSNDDYFGEEAESKRAVSLLVAYCKANPSDFERNAKEGKLIVRYAAGDRNAEKLLKEVSTSLPPRCEPKMITGMLSLDLRQAEDICGRKLGAKKGFWRRLLG